MRAMEATPKIKVRMIRGHEILYWMIGTYVARAEVRLGSVSYVSHGAGHSIQEAKSWAIYRLCAHLGREYEMVDNLYAHTLLESNKYVREIPPKDACEQSGLDGPRFTFRRGA